jgi:hypothetical protein
MDTLLVTWNGRGWLNRNSTFPGFASKVVPWRFIVLSFQFQYKYEYSISFKYKFYWRRR